MATNSKITTEECIKKWEIIRETIYKFKGSLLEEEDFSEVYDTARAVLSVSITITTIKEGKCILAYFKDFENFTKKYFPNKEDFRYVLTKQLELQVAEFISSLYPPMKILESGRIDPAAFIKQAPWTMFDTSLKQPFICALLV